MPPEEAFVAEYVANGPKYWCNPAYDASRLWRGVPINLSMIEAFREFFTDYKFSWNSVQLRTPLLIVMGRHDSVVPHLLWKDVLPSLQNVTYRLLEESGHTPQLEESERFDQVFLEWI